METHLTAADVLEMALQIETDAAAFYRQAAAAVSAPSRRRALLQLASMEADHEQIFASMRNQPTGDAGSADTGDQEFPGLVRTLASGVKDDLARRFTGHETDEEVLRKAIVFEKDSIIFFVQMKALLATDAQRERVDALISEELGHVLNLTSQLASPRA